MLKFNMIFAQEETKTPNETHYVPIFRSGHNLTFLLSGEYSSWSLSQRKSSVVSQQITSINATHLDPAFFARYTYHINIVYDFGFFVGSTFGIILSLENYGKLKPVYGVSFPTVLGGLALNFAEKFRLQSGIEYGAIWYPDMTVITDSGISNALAPVADMFSIYTSLDYFNKPSQALTLEFGYRQIESACLNDCSTTTYLNTLSLKNMAYFVKFGVTLQLGDIQMDFISQ